MKLNQTGRLLALFAAMLFAAPGLTAQDYCSSDGGNGYYDIYSIHFGDDLLNATGDDDGYGDYTDLLVDAEPGQDLTLSLQAGGPWWLRYYWRVWVDFDNDGSFAGDLQDEVNGYFTQYASIHIPSDFSGQARIRVNVSLHEYQGACAHYNTGEVEDYTLNAGAACAASAGTLYAEEGNVCFDGSAVLTAIPNGDAFIPEGFSSVYVLTEGAGLVIENAGAEPTFTVDDEGNYTIHTLVYDPATLDLGIVELGVTTGFDVFGLITEGGGSICASLDVPGAAFHVSDDACPVACATIEGLQFSNGDESVVLENGGTYTLSDLPAGFYTEIITEGEVGSALIAVEGDGGADFAIENFFPYTYPGGNEPWELGEGTYTVSASLFSFSHLNGDLCDEALFTFTLESCSASAGTMTADSDAVCFDGANMISATPNGDAVVPEGFSNIYVLTQGAGLTIVNAGGEPSFEVTEAGNYTIHSLVYNPETLDLGIVEFGVTTGFDVFGLITEGGGAICASLDVPGAPVAVEAPMAGTLSGGGEACLVDGSAMLTAMPNGDANVPEGYTSIFVLTQGAGLTIVNAGAEPSFEVTETGVFTIHTLVYNPATLDLGIVDFGTTTGVDVLGLISAGGGAICASLDVPGAPFNVVNPSAGTMTADADAVCFDGANMISATPNGDAVVPEGFSNIYVLTQSAGLTIVNAGGEPSFEVTEAGNYTIHSLVYNPETLDLGIVEFGVTTGFDVFGLITEGGGAICASLDVPGAPVAVEAPMAGTLSGGGEACLVDGSAMLTASPNGDANVPEGYSSIFVLTQGAGLTIVNAGAEPSFEVTETGVFTIHTLVYNPATLDLGIVDFGTTTGVDVLGLISEGGGAICASLDVPGAPFNVEECACQAFAGTLTADADAACFGGYTTISATANGDAVVPEGFSNIYVLTQGEGLVIVNAGGEPAFEVTEAGNYTIHSLVYDPATLDLGIVEFGVTTGFDVFGLITEGGGSICGSLDVAGAPVAVENPDAGHIQAESFLNCFELGESTTLVGIPNGDAIVPDGYEVLYVLTQAWDLTILGVNTVPEFEVDSWNVYRIHTLVYNPATLDLSIVTIGETTGFDVFGLLVDGGGDVCASLDVPGALFFAWKPWICDFLGNFYHNMTVEAQEVQLQKWMAEADSPEALERLLIEAAADVAVYPNPTVDVLNVELTGFAADQPVQVELHDVTGRVVMATAWNAGSTDRFELDLAAHKAGQYHLVLTQGNVRIHRQVVIMR